MNEAVFLGLALVTVTSGWCVVSLKNIIHCAFALLVSFFGVAGLLAHLGADFLAATQVLIYIGGVMILLLFAIMLSEKVYNEGLFIRAKALPALLVLGALPLILIKVVFTVPWIERPGPAAPMEPTTEILGRLLLNEYVLPFEVISTLLLAALIGAVVLIRKEIRRQRRTGER
jgi:NADH-quinone oxidoreductase subunit J